MGAAGKGGSFKLTLRRLWLLLWKNFLLCRRHYICTGFEIFLPTLFALIIALAKMGPRGIEEDNQSEPTRFPLVSELEILARASQVLSSNCYYRTGPGSRSNGNCTVGYVPSNQHVKAIMDGVQNYLPKDAPPSSSSYTGSSSWSSRSFNPFELKGFDTEKEMETYVEKASVDNSYSTIKVAIVFTGQLPDPNLPDKSKISYKIRFIDSYSPGDGHLPDTEELIQAFQPPGPRESRHGGNDEADGYLRSGFSGLQIAIDKALIRTITSETGPNISTQIFPYPPYKRMGGSNSNGGKFLYGLLLPILLVVGFIFIVPSTIRYVVSEKETGIKELMKMMGLPNWMHWLGWMLNSMAILTLSVTLIVIFLFAPFSAAGAVYGYSDPSLFWFILVLFAMAATSFCFFMSAFFPRPVLAIVVGIVLWLVTYFAVALPLDDQYQRLSLPAKLASSMVPSVALHWALKAVYAFEMKTTGAQWSNLFEGLSSVDDFSMGWICFMLIVDTIMYMFLTIYLENVLPKEFGVRKPCYYIFMPSTWGCRRKTSQGAISPDERRPSVSECQPGFEPEQGEMTPGIVISGLTKRFGNGKMAVDGVYLKMYDGEITALLGHNGAGKTTLMSVLTGLYAPTNGTASVNGYDINTSMDEVRQSLGLCPQHNMLFNKLTVEEHLMFFGRLKGLTSSQAKAEMYMLLERLHLGEKWKALSSSLSGGQMRKLSLGIALIGGTKVVILDEPTSGMDPEARRAIWDLLLEMRGQRTIILSTHFMEEADVLGDQIAIMAAGKVKCHGTPMFLKKFFGAGYTLKLTTTSGADTSENILATVQKHIPNASFKAQHSSNATDLAIILPNENKDTTKLFAPLFSELKQRKAELAIETVGLSLTTMDDVFVKVGQMDLQEATPTAKNGTELPPDVNNQNEESGTTLSRAPRIGRLALSAQQFWSLLVKRFVCSVRRKVLLVGQFIVPIFLLICAILLSNLIEFKSEEDQPPLKTSLDSYKNPKAPYSDADKDFGNAYSKLVGSAGVHIDGPMPMEDQLIKIGEKDIAKYRDYYLVGADFKSSSDATALFSSLPYHASPLAINLVSNAILNSIAEKSGKSGHSIEMTIHPLKTSIESMFASAERHRNYSFPRIIFGELVPIGLALFAATYIVVPVEEKLCKAKQLQLMTGVSPMLFWGSAFLWDFFMMIILSSLMLACFPIFQKYGAFTPHGGGGVFFLILIVYGFSAISFSYLVSLFAVSVAGGFSLVVIIHLVTGYILAKMCIFFEIMVDVPPLRIAGVVVCWFGRLFPTFGLAVAVMRYIPIAGFNSRCHVLSDRAKDILCDPQFKDRDSLKQCCEDCAQRGKCFQPQSYLEWESKSDRRTDVPRIGQELLYLFIMGVVYKLLLMGTEYGLVQRILSHIFKTKRLAFQTQAEDEDVIAENQRVQELIVEGRTEEDAFLVDNLSKNYGSFAAVANLSFGVHYSECFGLLGVNGAGKTTAFRILTGDEIPASGNAYSSMGTLLRNRKSFLSCIGYCPQFDGIVGVMTGREMLRLFARLRGIHPKSIKSEIDKWLDKLGLTESGNVQSRKYSGGMKRRLSAAMAMIGDCPIILLDEPTSGVDPIARRQFWEVIKSVNQTGQAVILTSHSMDECEALCSRLGIMVNGQFQCFGGVQHLKSKFAQGFSLLLKLFSSTATEESPELTALCEAISTKFNPCILKDRHQNLLQYQVLNTTISWDMLFTEMESLKDQYETLIEEYSVNETTLEEVFLSFARQQQYGQRYAHVSCFKKCITGGCCG